MRTSKLAVAALALGLLASAAERKVVTPANAPAPVGPYSPGLWAGDYLYVSGQGARDAKNELPATPEAQSLQTINNVKAIVEAAGLTMDHVVYLQTYLADLSHRPALEAALKQAFPNALPRYSLTAVHRMPTNTPVEISAVAVRDKATIKRGKDTVTTADRVYLHGLYAKDAAAAAGALKKAGVSAKNALALTVYHAPTADKAALEQALQPLDAAVSLVAVPSLPDGAAIEVTGIAARNAKSKQKPGTGPVRCAAADGAVYCAATSATAADVAAQATALLGQVDQTLQGLKSGLAQGVVSHVYVDNLDEFATMNKVYGGKFAQPYPTRTTVQPLATQGSPAPLVRISVIAVQ